MRSLLARVLLLVPLTAVACKSSSSTGPGGTANLAGTYHLLSFKEDTLPTFGPPVATGTLVLTTSKYNLNLTVNIPIPGDTVILADSGTYTTHGDSIAEQSMTGNPDALGTVAVHGDTLVINVTESVLTVATSWLKQ